MQNLRETEYIAKLPRKVGDKVTFNGVKPFWFTNITANGNKLTIGGEYTLKKITAYSSWTCCELEEVDGEFNFHWFK